MLVLTQSERCWSYAMQLRDESKPKERPRVHMRRKLHKAAQYAKQLEDICNLKGDQRTILEAEAYSSWMNGTYLLEMESWSQSLVELTKSR